MERQCDVEVMKVANGFLVMRPRGPITDYKPSGDMYCFQHFSGLKAWLYEHFRDEEESEKGEKDEGFRELEFVAI